MELSDNLKYIMNHSKLIKPHFGSEYYRHYNGVSYDIRAPLSLIELLDDFIDKPYEPENRLYFYYGNPDTLHFWNEISSGYPVPNTREPRIVMLLKKVDGKIEEPLMESKVLAVGLGHKENRKRKIIWDITLANDTRANYAGELTRRQRYINKHTLEDYEDYEDET